MCDIVMIIKTEESMEEERMKETNVTYNRAKMWQIGFFACNNSATNTMLILMMYISYYVNGIAGVAVMTVSLLSTAMRIFDGITDPVIGFIIDKTNSKFGKFRPTMILGYVIMFVSIMLMFNTVHLVPSNFTVVYYVFVYVIYTIGYTFQTACTKAAQACLTNDPSQRPKFALFDGIYKTILFAGFSIYISKFLLPKHGNQFSLEFFWEYRTVALVIAGILTALAVIGIWQKDREEFFGLGNAVEAPNVKFSDYLDVIKHNKAIQMLVFAASTDKLASTTMTQSTVLIIIFGIIAGDYTQSGNMSAYTVLPTLILLFIGIQYASKMGQKKALILTTWIDIVLGVAIAAMILFGDMTTFRLDQSWNLYTTAFIVLYILISATRNISGSIVIPMIADCADYETYRSGKYVPGMMGTLFSFVDKLISSFATTIVGATLVLIGFSETLPTLDTPLTTELLCVGVFLYMGLPIIGWICSLIAMKFYPLDAEKMANIQEEIQKIKVGESTVGSVE